jgi:hypothetical protein
VREFGGCHNTYKLGPVLEWGGELCVWSERIECVANFVLSKGVQTTMNWCIGDGASQ